MSHPVKLAFATDAGYFEPTLLALVSALHQCAGAVDVYFLGTDLPEENIHALRNALRQFDSTTLHFHALSIEDFGDTAQPDPNITLTMLARLFLPMIASGRVLYIDGDTLIEAPLAPLFDLDMQGNLLGCVRDLFVLRSKVREGDEGVAYFREIMGGAPVTDYFNSGVLLMDLDAISADRSLVQAMQDFSGLGQFRYLDQDRLNQLFAGRVFYLPHRWNSVWGRQRYQTEVWRKLGLPSYETAGSKPAILHFPGRKKPWKKLRLSTVLRGFPAFLRYRKFQRKFSNDSKIPFRVGNAFCGSMP